MNIRNQFVLALALLSPAALARAQQPNPPADPIQNWYNNLSPEAKQDIDRRRHLSTASATHAAAAPEAPPSPITSAQPGTYKGAGMSLYDAPFNYTFEIDKSGNGNFQYTWDSGRLQQSGKGTVVNGIPHLDEYTNQFDRNPAAGKPRTRAEGGPIFEQVDEDAGRTLQHALTAGPASAAANQPAPAAMPPAPSGDPTDCLTTHSASAPLPYSGNTFWNPATWTITNMGIEGHATSTNGRETITFEGRLVDKDGLRAEIDGFTAVDSTGKKIAYNAADAKLLMDTGDASAKQADENIFSQCTPSNDTPQAEQPPDTPGESSLRMPYTGPGVPGGSQISGVPASALGNAMVQVVEPGKKLDTFDLSSGTAGTNMQADALRYADEYLSGRNPPPAGIVWDPNDNRRVRVQLGDGSFAQVQINNYSEYFDPYRHPERFDSTGNPGIFVAYAGQSVYLQPTDFTGKWTAIVYNRNGQITAIYGEGARNTEIKGSEIPQVPIVDQAFDDARRATDMAQTDAHNVGRKFDIRGDKHLVVLDNAIRRDAVKYGIPLVTVYQR